MQNYKVTGTLAEITALEQEIFHFGAPFSAIIYGQIWDDVTKTYYACPTRKGGVTSWQEVKDEGNDVYSIIHIDMFTFSPKTIAEYVAEIPEDEAQQTETQKAVLDRVLQGYEDLTPQEYVSQLIIDNKYNIIQV